MTIYRIRPSAGVRIDANIELDDRAVILHSRGGPTGGRPPRNTEYQAALNFIIDRLFHDHQWIRRVSIDSAHSRRIAPDPSQRVLLDQAEIEAIGEPAEIVRVIRQRSRDFGQPKDVRGGNSTKLLRIETGWLHASLRAGLNLRIHDPVHDIADRPKRLTSEQQRRVSPSHIDAAVQRLLGGEDAPNFAPSRDYDLVTREGHRLAPKKVFGRALEIAGVVTNATPYHFSAGWSQPSFELLQAAGHSIISKDQAANEADRRRYANEHRTEIDRAVATIGVDPEEKSWIEGDMRMAVHLRVERRRSAKATAAKRAAVRSANDGRLACEHCKTNWYAVWPEHIANGLFDIHHTIPLKTMDEGHETSLNDLLCLCANCHRAEHRRMAFGN